jgi:ATP-dependent Zn protease
MRSIPLTERSSTLEIHTYAFAVRTALRRGRVFLPGNRLVGLRLPPGAAMDAYKDAAETILKSVSLDRYIITTVQRSLTKDETDVTDAVYLSRYKAALIILIQNEAELPSELTVGLDCIVDVAPVNPRHLVAAAKSSVAMDMPLETARKLAAFPADILFLALRPGRPLNVVLERLEAMPKPSACEEVRKPDSWQPGIEELEGYGEAKEWALELMTDLRDWDVGRIVWSDVSSGILLAGPTGTGKTLFGQALARSCGAKFMATSSAIWQSKGHLGDMLGAMRRTFADAKKSTPTVLLIDEIDAIGDRGKFKGNNADYSTQVVNSLLELLDGSGGREGVVVIGATNHPDKVDPALRRPGRLDRCVVLDLPGSAARGTILKLHLGTDIATDDLEKAAIATSGYSGADLAQAARDARRIARRQRRSVEISDFLASVPPVTAISDDERWEACLHEAGHAIVGLELQVAALDMIVVVRELARRDTSVGHVQWRRMVRRNRWRQAYLDEIAMLLGGMAAEEMVLGDILDGSGGTKGSDLWRVNDIATLMFANLGLGSLQYSEVSTAEELDELRRSDPILRKRIERLLGSEFERACAIIRRRRNDLDLIAHAVFERGVITGDDVGDLIGARRVAV